MPRIIEGKKWTDEEVERLRVVWVEASNEEIAAAFPDRSMESVKKKAQSLSLPHRSNDWTDAEEALLRDLWGSMTAFHMRRLLPGRTFEAIRHRAMKLKLGPRKPKGLITVSAAAARFMPNASHKRWERILRWGNVTITRITPKRSLVDPYEIEEVVHRWENESETLSEATLRLPKVTHITLKAAMVGAGKLDPNDYMAGDRFLRSDIDSALAEYRRRGGESIRSAAKRLGVDRSDLRVILIKMGVDTSAKRGRSARLDPEVIDRALSSWRNREEQDQHDVGQRPGEHDHQASGSVRRGEPEHFRPRVRRARS